MGSQTGVLRAYLWVQTWQSSRGGCSKACLHAAERETVRGHIPHTPHHPAPHPAPPTCLHLPQSETRRTVSFHTLHTSGRLDASPCPLKSPARLQSRTPPTQVPCWRQAQPPLAHPSSQPPTGLSQPASPPAFPKRSPLVPSANPNKSEGPMDPGPLPGKLKGRIL